MWFIVRHLPREERLPDCRPPPFPGSAGSAGRNIGVRLWRALIRVSDPEHDADRGHHLEFEIRVVLRMRLEYGNDHPSRHAGVDDKQVSFEIVILTGAHSCQHAEFKSYHEVVAHIKVEAQREAETHQWYDEPVMFRLEIIYSPARDGGFEPVR